MPSEIGLECEIVAGKAGTLLLNGKPYFIRGLGDDYVEPIRPAAEEGSRTTLRSSLYVFAFCSPFSFLKSLLCKQRRNRYISGG